MNDQELIARLKELQAKATPAPWERGRVPSDRIQVLGGPERRYICSVQIHQTPRHLGEYDEPRREANAEFIMELRNALPDIIRKLEAGREREAAVWDEAAELRCLRCSDGDRPELKLGDDGSVSWYHVEHKIEDGHEWDRLWRCAAGYEHDCAAALRKEDRHE